MKHMYLLVFISLSINGFAQYQTMPDLIQTTWMEESIAFFQVWDTIIYTNSGDTLSNGIKYQKLYRNGINQSNYVGAYRDNGMGQVYFLEPGNDSNQEVLLYDFSIDIGDTIIVKQLFTNSYTVMTPNAIGCVRVYNPTTNNFDIRKAISMTWLTNQEPANLSNYLWIEGLGSTKGLLSRGNPSGLDFEYKLLNIEQSNLTILETDTISQNWSNCFDIVNSIQSFTPLYDSIIYPNPCSVSLNIEIPYCINEKLHIRLCNSYGQLILYERVQNQGLHQIEVSYLESGIYILTLITNHNQLSKKIKIN